MRTLRRIAAVTAATLVLAACGGETQPEAATDAGATAVTIERFGFRPGTVTVEAGAEVAWTNTDEVLHTVTAGTPEDPGEDFDGQLDGAGSTFRHTFEEPGTYAYFCTRHDFMVGQIEVG